MAAAYRQVSGRRRLPVSTAACGGVPAKPDPDFGGEGRIAGMAAVGSPSALPPVLRAATSEAPPTPPARPPPEPAADQNRPVTEKAADLPIPRRQWPHRFASPLPPWDASPEPSDSETEEHSSRSWQVTPLLAAPQSWVLPAGLPLHGKSAVQPRPQKDSARHPRIAPSPARHS